MKTLVAKPGNKIKNKAPFFGAKRDKGFFGVQAKLKIGKSKDPYEVEADNVADRIVNFSQDGKANFFQPATPAVQKQEGEKDEAVQEKPLAQTITPLIQRKGTEKETAQKQEEEIQKQEKEVQEKEKEEVQKQEEEQVQEKEDEDVQKQEEEEPVQEKDDEEVQKDEDEVQAKPLGSTLADPDIEVALKENRGNGSPLPENVRGQMEDNFGANLQGVKIHTDNKAADLNKQLGAKAFTNKSDIYFNQGNFNPATKDGQHLLVHELTHTIQQGAVPVLTNPKQKEGEQNAETSFVKTSQSSVKTQTGNESEDTEKPANGEEVEGQVVDAEEKIAIKEGEEKTNAGQKVEEAKEEKKEDNYPRSPNEDPAFKAVKGKVEETAGNQQAHKPAEEESQAAQSAAVSPDNERQSMAQAGQVDSMDQQEPGEFNAQAFKAKLMERIKSMQLPKTAEEADDFEDNNNIDEVSTAANEDVSAEKSKASGSIEQATTQEPNIESVPERQVESLPEPEIGTDPSSVKADKAMPKKRPDSQVNQPLQENMKEVNQNMAENEVTDEQLSKANEPKFSTALDAKNEAKTHTESAPGQFRAQESQTLASSQQQAQEQGDATLQGMHGDRAAVLTQMVGQQQQTSAQDTAERTRIANEINQIYEQTKTDVETILSDLDEKVSEMFTDAADKAREKFEDYVDDEMDAYKDRRYSGVLGKGQWLIDKFKGLPDEVNQFFVDGRQVYIDEMDDALTEIAEYVAQKLTEAKDRITKGKQDVSDYVKELPESLQSIGQEAAESIQSKFDELEESVNLKQDELVDSLAQQYSDSLAAVDARIEEMKAANRGLIDMALGAIKGVIEIIINIKNTLTNLLSGAIDVIKTIIADPIGFLGNLISGLGQGFKNFGKNILKHLTSGLIGWLTGALGPMGITIPEDLFSLKGIFSLVMQILGLTWDYIRKKAVKLLGEPVVKALETGFEIFQIIRKDGIAGLWTYLKEKFTDLKETVIGAIKQMVITKVIEAGIKWVLGLMSPAGAFVKAAMMIIDIVKFFIERGSQIIEMVKAFIDGVKAVASGSVQKVADAIENALAKAIPVVIGFLASLLGIGGLASKVQSLIKKIRSRIDKAIDSIILKAKKWFKKVGNKIKGAVTKFVKWWKAKKKFKGNDGKSHELYLSGEGNSAKLMIASNPTAFTDFITGIKETPENKASRTAALDLASKIDAKKREEVKGSNEEEKNKNRLKKKEKIEVLMGELGGHAKILFGTAVEDLPETVVDPSSSNFDGSLMGTDMKAKPLTKKGKKGSVPTSAKHGIFDKLLKRRKGGSSYYVRGHLLNHNVHGPGQWENMTPLSKEGNRLHESGIESQVKAAVGSGAIVEYNVKPNYDRGELATPADADPIIKEIRSAEKHVPVSLTVEANLLKPDGKTKQKGLVSMHNIKNPVDTAIGSYELSSSKKEKVAIMKDSADMIAANTGIPKDHVEKIQKVTELTPNLYKYDQIKDKLVGQADVQSSVDKLKKLSNVTIHGN